MRQNLIMQFYCSNCGNQLTIFNGDEIQTKKDFSNYYNGLPKLPTSGINVDIGGIWVEPCKTCIHERTNDAQMLVHAIKNMQEKDNE